MKKEKQNSPKNKKKEKNNTKNIFESKTAQIIIYLILLIVDITIVIYCARRNYANYVSIKEIGEIFVGNTKNLLFGRNYITLIITFFFFVYALLCNKFLFNKKTTKKNIILTIIFLLILNITLFYIFTKKIY